MNDKQKRFCEFFAASGNATDAAKKAGYSERTAYSQGNRLLKNVECSKYIRELQEKAAAERIADISEVKGVWTNILRNEELKPGNRLRAGELLARSSGGMIPGADQYAAEGTKDWTMAGLMPSQENAIIMLPMIDGSGEFNAIQTENGDVIPLKNHNEEDPYIFLPFGILKAAIDISGERNNSEQSGVDENDEE